MTARRVALLAPPGVDLVAVAAVLAERLGVRAVDLDAAVAAAGDDVGTVVLTLGDDELRRRQAGAVAELLTGDDRVVALGSGAVEVPAVRSALAAWSAAGGTVVALDLPPHASARAAGLGAGGSPALGPVRAAWRALYERRAALTAQVASVHVPVEGLDPDGAARAVLGVLGDV